MELGRPPKGTILYFHGEDERVLVAEAPDTYQGLAEALGVFFERKNYTSATTLETRVFHVGPIGLRLEPCEHSSPGGRACALCVEEEKQRYFEQKCHAALSDAPSVVFYDPTVERRLGGTVANSCWLNACGIAEGFHFAGPVALFVAAKDSPDPSFEFIRKMMRRDLKKRASFAANNDNAVGVSLNGEITQRFARSCDYCHENNAKKKCANCKVARYCNRDCQVAHWRKHKADCHKITERI